MHSLPYTEKCKAQFINNMRALAEVDSYFEEPIPGPQKDSAEYNYASAETHP